MSRLNPGVGSVILCAMGPGLRAVQLGCILVAAIGAEASAAARSCPDEHLAKDKAGRGFTLRDNGLLGDAAEAFEAAYRCMPRDRKHEERWEHLASYLETVQELPVTSGEVGRARLCRARALIDDYRRSIGPVSPAPDAASYASGEGQRIEEELVRRFPGSGPCEAPTTMAGAPTSAAPTPAPTSAAPTPAPAMPEDERPVVVPPPFVASVPAADGGAASPAPARPLWVAGAVTGAASVIPAIIMGVGLRKGDQADARAAGAREAGALQSIRDDIHPDGVLGNRMAYAGAIVVGALLVTSVALLTAASRRPRASRARVAAVGTGVLVRF